MLVYRKVDPNKNLYDVSGDVPQYLVEQVGKRNQEYDEEKVIHKEKVDKISLKVTLHADEEPFIFPTRQSLTLKQILQQLYENYPKIQNLAESAEDIRLRLLDVRKIPGNDFYGKEDEIIKELSIYSHSTLLIETRNPGVPWRRWSPTEMSLQVFEWRSELEDQSLNCVDPDFLITVEQSVTVIELKNQIIAETNGKFQLDKLKVFQMTSKLEEIEGDQRKVRPEFRLYNGDKIYIEK